MSAVAAAFRDGGGVPYSAFRPEFTSVMDALGRGTYDELLIDGFLPLAGGTCQRAHRRHQGGRHRVRHRALREPAGAAYPRSPFTGYDLADDAVGQAREEAAEWGLPNATFEVLDVAALPPDPGFGAVFAFDAIHDQADPAGVLRRVHDALVPGGWFVMFDIKASSHVEDNIGNPFATLLYCSQHPALHDGLAG